MDGTRTVVMTPGQFEDGDRLPKQMWQASPIKAARAWNDWRDDRAKAANQVPASAMSGTDTKIVRTPHAEAYRRGYLAGRRGCTSSNNPYESDSRAARARIRGLLEGQGRQLTVVQDI